MNYYLNNVAANDKCCAAEAYKNVSLYYYVKHFSFGGGGGGDLNENIIHKSVSITAISVYMSYNITQTSII